MNENLEERIRKAASEIRKRTDAAPSIGIVLGSGLSDFARNLENPVSVPFEEIEGMPVSTVAGHRGEFVFGTLNGKTAVVQSGRVHYYEGYSQQEITIPIRVMNLLGVSSIILTNAAGGINTDYRPGDLMLISDHINYSGVNPLRGMNLESFGPRFPDMSDIYTKSLRRNLHEKCAEAGIELREGVYIMYFGPSYETPAEIRAFRTMGADAAGMSTAPEAIVARHAGMQVIGISCITNMAAGILDQKLTHEEISAAADKASGIFTKVLKLAADLL
ncbi:MAG: purine-nucleoside phosphorylase [Erysipelotrichia bacterium]|nr:purine-nucleoside phosphorylase [Erysipelotrichia bacterium]